MTSPSNEAYEIAGEEYEDDEIDRGFYERLYVEVDGDRDRARAAYIHRRAQELQEGFDLHEECMRERRESCRQKLLELEGAHARADKFLADHCVKVMARAFAPFVAAVVVLVAGWFWWVTNLWDLVVLLAISGATMSGTALACRLLPSMSVYEQVVRDNGIAQAVLGGQTVDYIDKTKYIDLAERYENEKKKEKNRTIELIATWWTTLVICSVIIALDIIFT